MRLSYKLCAFLAALLILIGAAIPALALSLPVTFSLSDGQTLTLPGEFGADARFSSSNPATTQVTVKKTAISLSTPVKQLYVGQSTQLAANFTPADSSLTVTWKSSNPQVLKVNESGVALGLRPGASTVTATLSNGSSARVSLTVKRASVHLDQKSATIFEGKTLQLTASITPDDVGDGGSTVIAGNRISLNIEGDDDDGHTSLYSDNGVNFRYETTGDSAKFAEINTSINGSDSDVSSRYALNIRATGFINAAGTPVHPSVKIYSSGKSSLEAERELYIASLQRTVTIDGNDFTAIRANVPYADISGSPSSRDYVFCTDGIYYGGVKIVST